MNIVVMVGRLTKDPDLRYGANSGKAVCMFSIAVDRPFKREGENNTDFFNCVAFGKTGEFVEKYFTQGKRIAITGNLQNDVYTGKDGSKKQMVKIICDTVEFADAKGEGRPKEAKEGPKEAKEQDDGFLNVPDEAIDEELPFI